MGKTIIVGDDEPGCGQVMMSLIGLAVLAICAGCGGVAWLAAKGGHPAAVQPVIVQPGVDPAANGNGVAEPVPPARNGTLLLKTRVAIIPGAQAWVEVNGNRAEWPVGTAEVKLPLPAGTYRVAVYSIYEKVHRKIYDRQVTVSPDVVTAVDVGP